MPRLALLRPTPLSWTPTFLVADRRGRAFRRLEGYCGPNRFLAELRIALGLINLFARRPVDALEHLRAAVEVAGSADPAPEALCWSGVGEFRVARDKAALVPAWSHLRRFFPASGWADRANCLEPLLGVPYGTEWS